MLHLSPLAFLMFKVTGDCGLARCGVISTANGSLSTPTMLLSARHGDVHSLTPDSLARMPGTPGVIINPLDL